MKRTMMLAPALALYAGAAQAQVDATAAQQRIDTLGRVEVLAEPCGLRDDAWTQDLIKAIFVEAVMPDASLGKEAEIAETQYLTGRLGQMTQVVFAKFVTRSAAADCDALAADPALAAADKLVAKQRARFGGKPAD